MKAKTSVTIETLMKHVDELKAKFGKDARVAYTQVSYTQLSVARHYGGCTIQGQRFIYSAEDDSLIREDVVKWVMNREKAGVSSKVVESKKQGSRKNARHW